MDIQKQLKTLLEDIGKGRIDPEQGLERLRDLSFLDLGHTRMDLQRPLRNGFPEVVYAEGKRPEQVAEIFAAMRNRGNILATRVSGEAGRLALDRCPEAEYDPLGRTLCHTPKEIPRRPGEIGIITAGTSDLPVAHEARTTCAMLGSEAWILSDVGVAGIHRLFNHMEQIRSARVLIVIAGMEGALASVIGGMVSQPVVAVPTSVGYGANLQGLSALLGMLTSCASGVTVVNIDNGFGAACAAVRINNLFSE